MNVTKEINIIGEIPIYWINLDRSKDRKQFMEKQFKQYNIKNNLNYHVKLLN